MNGHQETTQVLLFFNVCFFFDFLDWPEVEALGDEQVFTSETLSWIHSSERKNKTTNQSH